jgi:hypothetical protein
MIIAECEVVKVCIKVMKCSSVGTIPTELLYYQNHKIDWTIRCIKTLEGKFMKNNIVFTFEAQIEKCLTK